MHWKTKKGNLRTSKFLLVKWTMKPLNVSRGQSVMRLVRLWTSLASACCLVWYPAEQNNLVSLQYRYTLYCLTQLCHDGLTHQAHPCPSRRVEVVAGTARSLSSWGSGSIYSALELIKYSVFHPSLSLLYRTDPEYTASPVPEVKRKVSHQSPVSGSLNWLHTPTMSSIRLCWVADIEAPRADLGILARSNRERGNILMFSSHF